MHVAMLSLCWAYVGLCWLMLGLCWAYVGPMLALCWAFGRPADVDIVVFLGTAPYACGYVEPLLGLGSAMLAYVGAMLGLCWPMLSHSVALWTRVTLQVWACVKYVPQYTFLSTCTRWLWSVGSRGHSGISRPPSPVVFSLGLWFAFRFLELYTIASTILQQRSVILTFSLVSLHLSYMSWLWICGVVRPNSRNTMNLCSTVKTSLWIFNQVRHSVFSLQIFTCFLDCSPISSGWAVTSHIISCFLECNKFSYIFIAAQGYCPVCVCNFRSLSFELQFCQNFQGWRSETHGSCWFLL